MKASCELVNIYCNVAMCVMATTLECCYGCVKFFFGGILKIILLLKTVFFSYLIPFQVPMVICYTNFVNRHAATLFYIQPVGLHFLMDSITVVYVISHLHNYSWLSCLCHLYILLLICKVVSFLPYVFWRLLCL